MIECKDCCYHHSRKADACPRCGRRASSGLVSWLIIIVGFLVIVANA